MRKRAYDLEFQPKERRRRDQALRFLGGFCAIVLLLGIVSAVALQRDGLVDQLLDALRPTEAATEPPEGAWLHTGSALFLLCETDTAQRSLRFCALVRVDVTGQRLFIHPLSPQAVGAIDAASPGGGRKELTLEQALREGGPKELKAAVEGMTEGTIDRYISSNDDGFKRAVNLMGSVTVTVEEGINYNVSRSDFSLILAKGIQPLSGDPLLRYFRYLGTLGEEAALAQGVLLRRVLETYLAKPLDAAQLESRFNNLMNMIQTDISAKDFYTRQDLLLDILAQGANFTVEVKE